MEVRRPRAAQILATRSRPPVLRTTDRPSGAGTLGDSSSTTVVRTKATDYVHPPCSSSQVLFDKLSKILAIYECVVEIFEGFTPFQVLQFMLASKDMAYLITRDQDLLKVLCTRYFKVRPAPKLVVPCEWCLQPGCECAGCYQWDHNGYVCFQGVTIRCFPPKGYKVAPRREGSLMLTRRQEDLTIQLKNTDPTQRLWRFCVYCTKNLPKWTRAGRCVCNKSNIRIMCMSCKEKERGMLLSKGFGMWFRKRKIRQPSARGRGEVMRPPKYFCQGVDKSGWLCENEVGPLGGFPAYSVEIEAEGLNKERMVNICTWCGLIAVDIPNGPLKLQVCPGKANGSNTFRK